MGNKHASLKCMSTLSVNTDSVRTLSANSQIICSGGKEKTIRIRNNPFSTSTITPHDLVGHQRGVNSVCLSPNGDRLYSGSDDGTIKVWNVSTGDCLHTCPHHVTPVFSLCLSPNGAVLYSAGHDEKIRVWDTTNCSMSLLYCIDKNHGGHRKSIHAVCISSDGRKLYSGGADNTVKVWDARNGKLIANFAGGMANFDSMGSLRGKGRLSLRPTRHAVEYNATRSGVKPSRKRAEDVRDHQLRNDLLSKKGHLHAVVALCCTDNVVISGSKDMTIKIWDARTDRHVTTLRGHRGQITSLCTSLDSKVLFSSSADRTIKMWDLTGTSNTALICTARGHSHWVSDVCFESTSGCLLSSSFDCKIKAWKHCIDKKNKDQAEGKRTGGEENVLEDPCPVGRLLFANVLLADHSSVEEEDTQVVVDAMWWEDLEGGGGGGESGGGGSGKCGSSGGDHSGRSGARTTYGSQSDSSVFNDDASYVRAQKLIRDELKRRK